MECKGVGRTDGQSQDLEKDGNGVSPLHPQDKITQRENEASQNQLEIPVLPCTGALLFIIVLTVLFPGSFLASAHQIRCSSDYTHTFV